MKFALLVIGLLSTGAIYAMGASATVAEIGVTIEQTPNSTFVIQKVEPASPAEKAGLKKNDMITNVKKDANSQFVQTPEMSLEKVAELLRGPNGSQLTVQYLRHPDEKMKAASIVREKATTK